MAIQSLSRKGLVNELCTTVSVSALLTLEGRYYFEKIADFWGKCCT